MNDQPLVSEIMTNKVLVISPNENVLDVSTKMKELNIG